jgi:hypothetical protein
VGYGKDLIECPQSHQAYLGVITYTAEGLSQGMGVEGPYEVEKPIRSYIHFS